MSKIIGIDLGTTTSEIAYIKDGKPVIIRNDKYGTGTVIPSVVTIKKDEIVVGKKAKRQILARPECTVSEVKRLMGTDEVININGKSYIPQQISAMILKTLKDIAEEEVGEVSEAVITVPANFNDLQRKATKDAAKIAGLKVERIINEPTAAALSYGIDNLKDNSKILVYDLGGGTFDCTVLEMFEGILDVKASRGDNLLGGKDFDYKIEGYIKEYIKNNTAVDISKLTLRKKSEIKEAAEQAKKDLSIEYSTEILLNNFDIDENGDSIDIEIELTREKFDELTKDLLERTENIMNETLKASNLADENIDVVLAVGGSSRMNSVYKLLNKRFGEKVKKGINPDEAIALGAAVQAGIKNDDINGEEGIIITDACSHTLGTEIIGNKFSPIIYRDTKLPAKRSEIYVTARDNQTCVSVQAYQGESEYVYNNKLIGEFELTGIPEGPEGKEQIEITFEYDLNGMLNVSAKILSTGKVESRIMGVKGFTEEDINRLKGSTFNFDEDEDENYKNNQLYNIAKVSIEIAEKKIPNLSGEEQWGIRNIINDLKKAIMMNDENKVKELDEKLTERLFNL